MDEERGHRGGGGDIDDAPLRQRRATADVARPRCVRQSRRSVKKDEPRILRIHDATDTINYAVKIEKAG